MKVSDAIKLVNTAIALRDPNESRVEDYAERLKNGAVFPDIVVGRWPKSDKYGEEGIVDGLHRLAAHKKAGLIEVGVKEIQFKSLSEMLAFMYTANMSHGLTPTEGQRNARIKLLRQVDPTLNIDKLAEQFKLGRSSIDRILKDQQGEGKSGRKTGSKKSKAHKDLLPMKPSAFFKNLEKLEFTLEKKQPVADIVAFASPLDETGKKTVVDHEKAGLVESVYTYLGLILKSLK